MATRLILKPGRTQYEFHQPLGHRYVAVIARNSTTPLRVKLALRETRYPLQISGSFESSDTLLNDIHRISKRTQQVCMMDAYVDTPWREQAQWWGDAQVQALNTFHLADDARLLQRGLKIIGRQQLPNGLTFSHAPTNCQRCVIPGFSVTWGMTFHDHYWQTGSTDAFTDQIDKIDRLIGYFEGEGRDSNGLLRCDPRYWHYVDWAEVNTPQTIAPLNLWYLKMLEKLAATAAAAADARRHKLWLAIRADLARRITDAFWDRTKGLWRDGLEGKARTRYSVHSQMIAISNGLLPQHHQDIIRQGVLPFLHGRKVHGGTPSSFWATYVYAPLIRMGHAADVVRHIRKMYGPMVPHGGTWETFVFVPGAGSVSHAWAAHALQHLAASLGGIRQTAPAWQQVDFQPLVTLPEVSWANTRVPTPHGIIESKWRRHDNGRLNIALKLPPGVKAQTTLPGENPGTVQGRRKWLIEVKQ